jgi:hypothetical protein
MTARGLAPEPSAQPAIAAGSIALSERQRQILAPLATRYIWWKTADQSLAQPHRLIAQIMNLGDWRDVKQMRSWNFWHLQLGLPHGHELPPLPVRSF